MTEMKIDIGHKPELDEVEIFFNALVKAGKVKLEKDLKEFMKVRGTGNEEEKRLLVAIGMSFTMQKVGEMAKKFIDEGKIEDPLNATELFNKAVTKAKMDAAIELNENEDGSEDADRLINEVFDEKMKESSGEKKNKKEEYTKEDVEYAFYTIDGNFKKVAKHLADKFGLEASVTFLTTYCHSFLQMVSDSISDEDEDDDESPITGTKEVSIKEALTEMRKEGLTDMADALEEVMKKNGDAEIKVFRMKNKNKDNN